MAPSRNVVGWFEIYVQDLDRARAFYEATFAVRLQEIPGPGIRMLAFPAAPGAAGSPGALVRFEGKPPGDGGTVVYFSCEDCAVEAGRAAGLGGRVLKPKFPIGAHGFVALVHDSEGNLIGLHSGR
jgi:predicted enzyme related to lactoylglutathione lyase